MKSAVAVFLALAVSTNAFTAPMMATRAVKQKPVLKKATPVKKAALFGKKAPVKSKVVAKKVVKIKAKAKAKSPEISRKSPPSSKGYPSFAEQASQYRIVGISGGGNKSGKGLAVPDFSDPKMQKTRDPAFYAAAAKTRVAPFSPTGKNFVIDDGLTDLERKQRTIAPSFLTGSAKNVKVKSDLRPEVESDEYFGLGADRFQLLFITLFGVFGLVGCLSGNVPL